MPRAHSLHTRSPGPRPSQRTPCAPTPRALTSPDSRVTFQVRSFSPPSGHPCVSAYSPTPPSPVSCGARAERRSAQPARAESKARGADPGLPAPPLRLRGSGGRGPVRCGPELRWRRCCRLAPPPGPVQRRRARKEGGKEGGEEEKEGAGVSQGYGVEEPGAAIPKSRVIRVRTHTRPNLYFRDQPVATAAVCTLYPIPSRVRQLK